MDRTFLITRWVSGNFPPFPPFCLQFNQEQAERMPRPRYQTHFAKLTWHPKEDVVEQFLPISTSTLSTLPHPLVQWVREHAEAIHAVRQRHPGGTWHWHISFRMKRELSSAYFYNKPSAKSWWHESLKTIGYESPEVEVTPEEDGRAFGYEHQDEFEVMYTDYDITTINTAVQYCAMLRDKKRRREYMAKISTLPKAKINTAVASVKVDRPDLSSDFDAKAYLVEEGWAFEGDDDYQHIMRKRYREDKLAKLLGAPEGGSS